MIIMLVVIIMMRMNNYYAFINTIIVIINIAMIGDFVAFMFSCNFVIIMNTRVVIITIIANVNITFGMIIYIFFFISQ